MLVAAEKRGIVVLKGIQFVPREQPVVARRNRPQIETTFRSANARSVKPALAPAWDVGNEHDVSARHPSAVGVGSNTGKAPAPVAEQEVECRTTRGDLECIVSAFVTVEPEALQIEIRIQVGQLDPVGSRGNVFERDVRGRFGDTPVIMNDPSGRVIAAPPVVTVPEDASMDRFSEPCRSSTTARGIGSPLSM